MLHKKAIHRIEILAENPELILGLESCGEVMGAEIGYRRSVQELLEQPLTIIPGCILLQAMFPLGDGREQMEALRQGGVHVPVLVLSEVADVASVVGIMKAGAFDFLSLPATGEQVAQAIQKALTYSIKQFPDLRQRAELLDGLASLTPREREVMDALIRGAHGKEIARDLDISPRTVEHHRSHILEKMGGHNLTRLTYLFGKYAINNA